jgi:hypothetical protein
MTPLKTIEDHGLSIVQDGDLYAVSIDATGSDPTDEQRREQWNECRSRNMSASSVALPSRIGGTCGLPWASTISERTHWCGVD